MDNTTGCRAFQGRIALLEDALAEYAHRYGLTERARAAFRAASPIRVNGKAEALDKGGAPGREP
jgi:hypothetical protein